MQFNKINYISVPQKYGQKKDGVEKGPFVLEKNGLLDIFKNISQLNIIRITEPTGESETVDGIRNKKQCVQINKELQQNVMKYYSEKELIINVGGDHSIAVGSIAGVINKNLDKRVGIIWFDAHADINCHKSSLTGNVHGMPLSSILGFGIPELNELVFNYLTPKDIAYVGLRSVDEAEQNLIDKHNILSFTASDVNKLGMSYVIEKIKEKFIHYDVIHLSFDIDGIDPKYIIGTGTSVPNGVSLDDALLFLNEIKTLNQIHSVDIVEFNPLIEEQITSKNVLTCINTLIN